VAAVDKLCNRRRDETNTVLVILYFFWDADLHGTLDRCCNRNDDNNFSALAETDAGSCGVVAQAGNMGKIAAHLAIMPPVVSKSIADLKITLSVPVPNAAPPDANPMTAELRCPLFPRKPT
jgi:hypothetical protein